MLTSIFLLFNFIPSTSATLKINSMNTNQQVLNLIEDNEVILELQEIAKKLQIFEIGRPNSYYRICIPPNIWHGFKCISNTPSLIANCANMIHDAHESIVLPYNDNYIPLNWNEL